MTGMVDGSRRDAGGGGSGNAPDAVAWPWGAVPVEIGSLMGSRLGEVVAAVIAAVRAEVPAYDRPLEGEFGRLISRGVTVALEQFVNLLGHDMPPPDLAIYQALGRGELREGRTLDALQSAYHTGARVAWRHFVVFGEEQQLPPAVMYRLAEAIFAYIHTLAGASVAGFAQEQSARAGSAQARRHALVELLVRHPPADPAEVERAADQAGWALPSRVAVLVVGDADPAALGRRMPPGTIGAALEPVAVLVVPDPDAPGRLVQIAGGLRTQRGVLGPSVPWTDAHHSARRAQAAWPLHEARQLGGESLARADEHLLALLLAADRRLARDLVAARLAPLEAMPLAARERATSTLRAWLDAHGDVTAAADDLRVHAQTVRYRLARLQEDFGDVLGDPVARLELALALRAADQLAPPAGGLR
jgi:hypothetical protein